MMNSRPRMSPARGRASSRYFVWIWKSVERQVLVRRVQVLDQQREHLLVRRREQVVAALAVLEPEDVRAVLGPAARRLVRLLGQQRREVHLLRAGRGHLLADDLLDLGQHAQARAGARCRCRGRRGGCSPARTSRRWLATSASTGSSRSVRKKSWDRRMSMGRSLVARAARGSYAIPACGHDGARAGAARGRGARAVPARARRRPRRDRGVDRRDQRAEDVHAHRPTRSSAAPWSTCSGTASGWTSWSRRRRASRCTWSGTCRAPAGCAGRSSCRRTPCGPASHRSRCGCASTTAPGST